MISSCVAPVFSVLSHDFSTAISLVETAGSAR